MYQYVMNKNKKKYQFLSTQNCHFCICHHVSTIFFPTKMTWKLARYCESWSWPKGYKKNFMFNSAEHEIYPAHKC